jgi:hypothetical protein
MEDRNVECAKCLEQTEAYLSMRCNHNLCLECASRLVKQVMNAKRLPFLNSLGC